MAHCPRHDLAAGPDGRCVLCRRETPPQTRASRNATAWVGGGLAALALLVAFLAFKPSPAPAPVASAEAPIPVAAPGAATTADSVPEAEHALPTANEPPAPSLQRTVVTPAPPPPPVASAPPPTRAEMHAALQQVSIEMYATSWCPVCQKARAWLTANQIPFTEYDVDHDDAAKRRQLLLNPKGSVPTIDVDGQVMIGFGERGMGDMIQRAVDRRVAKR